MAVFYNVIGTVIGILALLMLTIRQLPEAEGRKFNAVKRYLSAMFLLTSLSMFVAQLETRLPEQQFEKLNALMILFFFLIAQGFIYSILVLYDSPYANRRYLKNTLLPTLPLFALYTIIYLFRGDVRVYSAEEFMLLLPHEFLLVLRCVILLATVVSIAYGVYLCHKAKNEYDRRIANYFSQTDFARSIWLYKLIWCAEALSIWVMLTYFYTTPIIEVVVGLLITAVFVFYIKEFREYVRRYETMRPAILFDRNEVPVTEVLLPSDEQGPKMHEVHNRIRLWIEREDRPFTHTSLTIGDVSRETGIPKRKVSQYVNSQDDNFCCWINKLRVEAAARMLRESTEMSITEIGESVGFCDLPAFSRAFKKVKGVSPRAFRDGD